MWTLLRCDLIQLYGEVRRPPLQASNCENDFVVAHFAAVREGNAVSAFSHVSQPSALITSSRNGASSARQPTACSPAAVSASAGCGRDLVPASSKRL